MRLIDADALIETMEFHVTTMSVCSTTIEARAKGEMKRTCIADVANAPTIDAIPVEWLNERHRKCCEEGDTDLMDAITVLCNEYHVWQKEQEAQDS